MKGSIDIGRLFGIPVRLHWTFLVLLYIVLAVVPRPIGEVLAGLAILGTAVLLHELGHCLMARRFGIGVIDITFWPLGGMARMNSVPEDARIEGFVAAAGPAVNFVLAALSALLMLAFGAAGIEPLAQLFAYSILVNIALGSFNLVPAFPLDGGRILRAILARSSDWVRATEQAVATGRIIATVTLIGSILWAFSGGGFNCAIPMIAAFVWYAGSRELMGVRLRHGQSPFGGNFGARFEQQFASRTARPSGATAPPDVEVPLTEKPRATSPPPPPRGGFTEEYIRELERTRGRLRRSDDE